MNLRLKIELVPNPLQNKGLSSVLPYREWRKIAYAKKKRAGRRCEICGDDWGGLNCHEIWSYNDETHVQKLEGFIVLCDICHQITHIDCISYAGVSWAFVDLSKHFMDVNKCDEKTYKDHKDAAIEECKQRSKYEWTTDYGEYHKLFLESASVHVHRPPAV